MLATLLTDIKQILICKIYSPMELWFVDLNQNVNVNPAVALLYWLVEMKLFFFFFYSLLPPGQQEGVIEQVEVHRFGWELEL